MKIFLNKSDYEKIRLHAEQNLPEEACGLIAGTEELVDGETVRYVKKVFLLENTDHSNEHFTISPQDQLKALKETRSLGLRQLGNWHSHPESPSRQSEEDKRLSYDHNANYLIISLMDREHPMLNSFHFDGKESTKEDLQIID